MKRFLFCMLALALCLCGCSLEQRSHGDVLKGRVSEDRALLLAAVEEMVALGEERVYVAVEDFTENEEEEPAVPTLVYFVKESDERERLESEVLRQVIESYGLKRIYLQTSADNRRSVIFTTFKETEKGHIWGFYYSFDGSPCGWWGRQAELVHKDGSFLQINRDGSAWYRTLLLEEGFYYYEKQGEILG